MMVSIISGYIQNINLCAKKDVVNDYMYQTFLLLLEDLEMDKHVQFWSVVVMYGGMEINY